MSKAEDAIQATKKRDRQSEDAVSKDRFIEDLVRIREKRDAGELGFQMTQIAQAMVLCGLPYSPTNETKIVRRARLGDGSTVSVTFSAGLDGIPMPYGSDRTLLHWMIDKAIKTQSPVVNWDTATEFLRDVGMADSGKNRKDLKQRYLRLTGLTIGVVRKGSTESTVLVPFIEESHLPTSVDLAADRNGHQLLKLDSQVFGFRLGDRIFKEILQYHVPVPFELLQATKKKSQLQDLLIFLYWRSFAAQSEVVIPWESLREQLWQEDSVTSRIRTRFKEAILIFRTFWPELNAEAEKTGLRIGPPLNNRHLVVQADEARRLETPDPLEKGTDSLEKK
ncbi:RepA protein [Granulicella rosea]|uniref:RepA protein n=1 Tax=Granulicella rosea TaxID=474952 RepID=A0A239LAW0_9BACT|nr:replication protein RepA [Granulicella rosea]SNT27048.1 RepA protein [Granulicella rosea]